MTKPSTATWFVISSVFVLSAVLIHVFIYPNQLGALIVNSPTIQGLVDEVSIGFHEYYTGENIRPIAAPPKAKPTRKKELFTETELLEFNGEEGSPGIYLSILGYVFDVEKGRAHYGPGGTYNGFAGRDASKAFVTGDFSPEGLSDDVIDLTTDQLMSLNEWEKFYRKDYSFVGKVVGRYFDLNGEPTEYSKRVNKKIADEMIRRKMEASRPKLYPPCNSEWVKDQGGRVWCTASSGGVERGWVGYPRLYKDPEDSSGRERCVCVEGTEVVEGSLRLYPKCGINDVNCVVPDD